MLGLLMGSNNEEFSHACSAISDIIPFVWEKPRARTTIAQIRTAHIAATWVERASILEPLEAYALYYSPIEAMKNGVQPDTIKHTYGVSQVSANFLEPYYRSATCGENMHRILLNIKERDEGMLPVLRAFLKAHRDERMQFIKLHRYNIVVPNNTVVPMKGIIAAMMNIENFFETRQLTKKDKVIKTKET